MSLCLISVLAVESLEVKSADATRLQCRPFNRMFQIPEFPGGIVTNTSERTTGE